MKVKFNKELLLKQRFWVIASVTVVLSLFGLVYLAVYGSEESRKEQSKLKGVLTKAKSYKPGSNPTVNEKIAAEAEKARKAESVVWSDAYRDQGNIFLWPAKMEKEFEFLNGRFANEIKISKLTNESEWPADSEFLLHGKLLKVENEWINIQKRKGETVKLYRTAEPKIILVDDNNTSIQWGNDFGNQVGKLLAVTYQTGKYFGDGLTEEERRFYFLYYKDQLNDILKSVDPVDEKGNGVVQLRNWLFHADKLPDDNHRFFRYVTKEWDRKSDFSKEAWIAQENIWIQREIYRIIRAANDEIATFSGAGGDNKDAPFVFRNANFELTLTLLKSKDNKGTLRFEIANLLSRRQKLDLNFRVRMNKQGTPLVVRVSGLPLMPKEEKKNNSHSQDFTFNEGEELPRTGIYSVEQILTWESAAVKRIDYISIGSNEPGDISHSHRGYELGLRPFDEKDMPKPAAAGEQKMAGMPAPPGGAPPPGAPPPLGGVPFGGAQGGGGNKTMLPHDLWTDRYVDGGVTEQSRRIPVAISLIVDQDHVNRVMTQFNNSKLRFLHSQVLLNHYSGSLQPALLAEKKDGPAGLAPPGFPPMGPMPMGPMPMGPMGAGAGAGGSDTETNIELVFYGVMTIYQRYPPRPGPEKKQ